MRLKQVVLKGKIDKLRAAMSPLEEKREDVKARREALNKREEELMQALNEVEETTPEEDLDTLKEQVDQCISEVDDVKQEEADNEQAITDLQEQITQLEQELAAVEAEMASVVTQEPAPETNSQRNAPEAQTRSKEEYRMHKSFYGLTFEQRDAMFRRDDVKTWINNVRSMVGQKRGVNHAEVAIPTVVLDLITDNMEAGSKLIKHVNLQRVPGKARQTILGVTPEAIWTEACGKLNELDLDVFGVEMDAYKVGGFIPVCNAILEDAENTIKLGEALIESLIKSIGLALDKAILYGTGNKMPLGIVTRLTQTVDPGSDDTEREWVDLSKTNVISIASGDDGIETYKAVMTAAGKAASDYARGAQFWAMNRKTRVALMAATMSFTATGTAASAVNDELPLIGGKIETLEFIPDGVIVGGYGELYPLAERAEATIAVSEHVRFIEDQTVFKGTARYDGKPAIAEAFVAMHINGGTVTAGAVTFAQDKANA